ncbi:MAG: FAD-binding and (Fe-S)-binding domain-containing protein, partial [Melioribacteraceae bacterium]
MLTGKYLKLYNELKSTIPEERLFSDELRTLAYGTDASFYRLTPKFVVKVTSEEEIISVIKKCNEFRTPSTFRASGTSLSGQSITDSVLIVADRSWNKISTSKDKSTITVQPAVLGGRANLELSRFNKKIGPDPASINAATVSGIASNNASGMTSGVEFNTYNTLEDMRIIFADGTLLDTSSDASRKKFFSEKKEFINHLLEIASEAKVNFSERISKKYLIKNTTGYSINSLIDFGDPIVMIKHLMIGAEGTLGFISEITLKTVPSLPNKGTALVLFPNIKAACSVIPLLKELPVDAAEIMDRASLRAVEDKPGLPSYLKELSKDAAALLIETSSSDVSELQNNISEIKTSLSKIETVRPIEFTTDKSEYTKLWNVRKGLFPSVSKARKPGTTVVIEDVNFETSKLADTVSDLQDLFVKHKYHETIIWGHALSGNIHFVFSQDFNNTSEINRYKSFMDDVVKLVIEKYDGSLKAEHGTGRNMAPFVKYEWGEEIYGLMLRIKKLFDPTNILNPGVLINDDSEIHIKNLKPTPIVNPIIDKCIDCGFCEDVCPSKNLTLTPRQRITVWREINKLKPNNQAGLLLQELEKSFDYFGEKTCATDGLCELACPVDIDTGKLIKQIRAGQITDGEQKFAKWIAENLRLVTTTAKYGLNFARFFHSILGENIMQSVANGLRNLSGNKIPAWNVAIPSGADFREVVTNSNKDTVVYFPSCISRTMGNSKNSSTKENQTDVMQRLLVKAGYNIVYPENINSLCCGMPFASKGFVELGNYKADELTKELMNISEEGKYPILYDTSPCT